MFGAQRACSSRAAFAASFVLALALVACNERPHTTGGGGVGMGSSGSPKPKKEPKPLVLSKLPEDEPSKADAKPASEKESADDEPEGSTLYGELSRVWGLGELQDLGPAAPATATPDGVLFVTRDDHLLIAKEIKGTTKFAPLNAAKERFAKYGRGPSVSRTHAYWVSERNLLLRAALKDFKPEVLFDKARLGTRTDVVTAAGRDIVAFIAEIDGQPLAYVFGSKKSGKHEIVRLSPEGSGATSVALVEGQPHPRAILLAGRLGMSPVHVRRIRTTEKRLTLEMDEVVWIAPGSHVLTEIFGIRKAADDAVAFLATAKDFNDFGLAQLEIAREPGEIPEPDWKIYENGLDPAPVATARLCGKPHVLYARPTERRPRSPQELHLAPIQGTQPGEGEIIGRSRAYADLSVAPTDTGAIVVWTADHRTWGMVITCPE